MAFALNEAKAAILSFRPTKQKRGAAVVRQYELSLMVEVDDRSAPAVAHLFPAYTYQENEIAGLEGGFSGLEIQSLQRVGKMSLVVVNADGDSVFSFSGVELKGKPKLKISSIGDGVLFLSMVVAGLREKLVELHDYLDADVYLNAEVEQKSLPMDVEAEAENEPVVAQQDLESPGGDEVFELRTACGWTRKELADCLAGEGFEVDEKLVLAIEESRKHDAELQTAAVEMLRAEIGQ